MRQIPDDIQESHTCDDCTQPYVAWFAPSVFWNHVMGGPTALGDPGGMVCMTCFAIRAYRAGYRPITWQLTPEWPWRQVQA